MFDSGTIYFLWKCSKFMTKTYKYKKSISQPGNKTSEEVLSLCGLVVSVFR